MKKLLFVIASIGLLSAAVPDDATVSRLREQIEQRQRERRDVEPAAVVIELKDLGVSIQSDWPDLNKAGDLAVIRLVKESSNPALAIRIVPAGRDLEPVQIPNWGRGDQWVALDPGRWRLEVHGRSGLRPDSGNEKTGQLQYGELNLARRGRYELRLDDLQ